MNTNVVTIDGVEEAAFMDFIHFLKYEDEYRSGHFEPMWANTKTGYVITFSLADFEISHVLDGLTFKRKGLPYHFYIDSKDFYSITIK